MAVRKSVSTLSVSERMSYVDAVLKLKTAPSQFTPPTTSRYDDYVYIHMQAMLELTINDRSKPVANGNWTMTSAMRMPMWAHRCPAFLPWHRELLYQFERDLQTVSGDASIGIPYWDWSIDQSKVGLPWLSDFMGGDGADGSVTTGPFAGSANWKLNISEDGAAEIVRGFGLFNQGGVTFPRLPARAEVNACLAEASYDGAPWNDSAALESFRNRLEGWFVPSTSDVQVGMHNLVHLWVGGNGGTMLPSTSPNDPVFFLHHSNVDRLWAVWQQQHPSSAHYLPALPLPSDPGQGLTEPMIFYDSNLSSTPPWSDPPATPSKVMDHNGLGYRYDFEPSFQPKRLSMAFATSLKRRVRLHSRDRFRLRMEEHIDQLSQAISFARDIRPLFTDEDVQHMTFAFDLSSYTDVKSNSAAILDRVKRDASDPQRMPPAPRLPWTDVQIQLFQDWINGNYQP